MYRERERKREKNLRKITRHRVICGFVNCHVDTQEGRIKSRRFGYLREGNFNTYEGQDRWIAVCCLNIFAKRGSSKPPARAKVFTLFNEGKKGQRVGGSGCSLRKSLSLKEALFQPFLLRLPLCRRNGYVYWVVRHLSELSMCQVICDTLSPTAQIMLFM